MDTLTDICLLFLSITWLPLLTSGQGMNLTYFISKNKIMMLKCEIPGEYCCPDINKVEFFKNGEGVCLFEDCQPFFDVPMRREDTRFYRCGCSAGKIRKTHLITTEFRSTDYGNWSCRCWCGGTTCRSNTVLILPPDSPPKVAPPVFQHQDESSPHWNLYGQIMLVMFISFVVMITICSVCIFTLKKRSNGVTVGRSTCLSKILCLEVREDSLLGESQEKSMELQEAKPDVNSNHASVNEKQALVHQNGENHSDSRV